MQSQMDPFLQQYRFDLPNVTKMTLVCGTSAQLQMLLKVFQCRKTTKITLNVRQFHGQVSLSGLPCVDTLKFHAQYMTFESNPSLPFFSEDIRRQIKHIQCNGHGIVVHRMIPGLVSFINGFQDFTELQSLTLLNMMDDYVWNQVHLQAPTCTKLDLSHNRNLTLSRPLLDQLNQRFPNLQDLHLNQCNLTKYHFINLESWLPSTKIIRLQVNLNEGIDKCLADQLVKSERPLVFPQWQPVGISMIGTTLRAESQKKFFQRMRTDKLKSLRVPVQEVSTIQRLLIQSTDLIDVTLDFRSSDGSTILLFLQSLDGSFFSFQKVVLLLSNIQLLMYRKALETQWSLACPDSTLLIRNADD
jgi:hypothetical protein